MIKYLNNKNAKQYGIEFTFRIIPRSLKHYKMMTIYVINPRNNKPIITVLIFLKFKDKILY